MKQFQVLDRNQLLHQHYLLEASAGTGKTFSIQNIVTRLLIEENQEKEPLSIQHILIVTFTRASTRDLKLRVRANIEQALYDLQSCQKGSINLEKLPDYLQACIEKGEKAVGLACKRLQQALFTFDQSQIFTIHSFCARMLRQFSMEGDIGVHSLANEASLSQLDIKAIISDFFRTEMAEGKYSLSQVEIILKVDPEQRKLLKYIQTGYEFPVYPSFKEGFDRCCREISALKKELFLESEKMVADFISQAKAYRNATNGETKAVTLAKISRFAKLFDQDDWSHDDIDMLIRDGLVWGKALDQSLLKGKIFDSSILHYPSLTQEISKKLLPLIEELRDPAILLLRMARECRQLFHRYQREEEKLSHDDILCKMNEALNEPNFLSQIQSHYQAAIIDEFQDTDPIQWQIFSGLFLSKNHVWDGYLYLVGDPKQSIYSFRQADIYTYLAASEKLGEERRYSLSVNYRSQQSLVRALNTLFDAEHLPHFISLPKNGLNLSYQPVHAAKPPLNIYQAQLDLANLDDVKAPELNDRNPVHITNIESVAIVQPQELSHRPNALNQAACGINQERGAIHFVIADGKALKLKKLIDFETEVFFPFIAKEIVDLIREKQFAFQQFAILVKDRFQAARIAEYLEKKNIPLLNQKGSCLTGSMAHQAMTDLIKALLHLQDRGAARCLLASPLMGWTHDDLKEENAIQFAILFCTKLRAIFFERGFSPFFHELLHANCNLMGQSVIEQILSRKGGKEFYRDLQQIADIIIENQSVSWNSLEGILSFIDQFQLWDENDDHRLKKNQDPTEEGVRILTSHSSKGLEFDIVFALGMLPRTHVQDELIPVEVNGKKWLLPVDDHSIEYFNYCEECDAEKMRQLYVAFTRAKIQLYIPVALHIPSEKLKFGEASPMDIFLAKIGQSNASSYEMLYARIKGEAGLSLMNFLETLGQKNFISYSLHRESVLDNVERLQECDLPILHPPMHVIVPQRSLVITSFSILNRHHEEKEKRFEILFAPHDFSCLQKTPFTLPTNQDTGLVIHHILERISFSDFKNLQSEKEITSKIRSYIQNPLFLEWDSVIAHLIFNVLKTPLHDDLGQFSLSDLQLNQMYREMSFIFPYHSDGKIEEFEVKEGMIRGVIDCLFCHKGLYYLVDWKTNWLGPHYDHYGSPFLENAMKDNGYFLQASIYTEAIKRYLKLVDNRPFEKCFGGIFYLFLRGIQPGKKNGIYYAKTL